MRYGIISDIHGNLEAFEKSIDSLSREEVDKILCVGDIVGYGADPVQCIARAKDSCNAIVGGNHDEACCGSTDTRFFNDIAREAVLWTTKTLKKSDISFLKALELIYCDGKLTIVHGTLQSPEEFHYMLDSYTAEKTFSLMETQICFVGHTHVPGVFTQKSDKTIEYQTLDKIKIEKGKSYIINAGSVGQPRDGNARLAYCVYDTEKDLVEIKREEYNIEKAQRKILKAGLPSFLAYRLGGGA